MPGTGRRLPALRRASGRCKTSGPAVHNRELATRRRLNHAQPSPSLHCPPEGLEEGVEHGGQLLLRGHARLHPKEARAAGARLGLPVVSTKKVTRWVWGPVPASTEHRSICLHTMAALCSVQSTGSAVIPFYLLVCLRTYLRACPGHSMAARVASSALCCSAASDGKVGCPSASARARTRSSKVARYATG